MKTVKCETSVKGLLNFTVEFNSDKKMAKKKQLKIKLN